MALTSKNKVDSGFSMSSMTDIIFLLLIFFMLTSNFITPSGLNVNLPSSKRSEIVMQKVSVTISEDLKYMVNNQEVNRNSLETVLRNELQNGDGEGVVKFEVNMKKISSRNIMSVIEDMLNPESTLFLEVNAISVRFL